MEISLHTIFPYYLQLAIIITHRSSTICKYFVQIFKLSGVVPEYLGQSWKFVHRLRASQPESILKYIEKFWSSPQYSKRFSPNTPQEILRLKEIKQNVSFYYQEVKEV